MLHRRWTIGLVTLTATMIVVGGEVRAQQPRPAQTRLKLFWSSPEDPVPQKRRVSAHFWAGNERELYIFYRDLKDLGGSYLGVGSDQCYLLLGWMKARFAWCVDYDEKVVLVHLIHQAFFRAARTPKAFLSLWRRRQRKNAALLLEQTYANDHRRKDIGRVFHRARASVYTRLYRMSIYMRRARTPSYLSTQSQYDFVRKRVLARRVRPMLGNLLIVLLDKALSGPSKGTPPTRP